MTVLSTDKLGILGGIGVVALGWIIVGSWLIMRIDTVTFGGKNVDYERKMGVGSDIGWLKSSILPEK